MSSRRDFGTLRRLPSGRWQVRHAESGGRRTPAELTFSTKAEASTYLARVQADQSRGVWVDPSSGDVPFRAFAASWMAQRPSLRPRTVELYEGIIRRHLVPELGAVPLGQITPALVRRWHAGRLTAGVGPVTVAKSYRLLKTMLTTAVEDELLVRNPCVLKGAGTERTPERVPPTIAEVDALAEAVEPRFRLLVLLGAWSGLRWGELVALKRMRFDLLHGTVRVTEQIVETARGWEFGPPKTDAGRRTIAIPPHLLPEVTTHLDRYVETDPVSLVFTGERGAPLMRRNFNKRWHAARASVGLPHLHFHDLRHLAATLAATTGATTRDLMARMGHASPRAALIYQHSTSDRDAAIAGALSELAAAASVSQLTARPVLTSIATPQTTDA